MNFSDKLDFLLNLTNTSNSTLAKHTSLDPSFISRLRSGSRKPSRNENYISPISVALVKRCKEDYHLQGLKDKLISDNIPLKQEGKSLEAIVENWLRNSNDEQNSNVGNFIKELNDFSFRKQSTVQMDTGINYSHSPLQDIYHGIEGKRSAVLRFLMETLNSRKTHTLYLYSDEDLSWLIDDPKFTLEWSRLFMQVLQKGNKVKIVHTITRSLDEMFAAINEWMPFYLTGNIEPYYYPRTRDVNFRRTIFITPGLCAVSSNSIGRDTSNNLNLYLTDQVAVNSLLYEFDDFLKLCRPLMKIFNSSSNRSLMNTINEFEYENGDCILKSRALSSITLPLFAIEKFLRNHSKEERETLFDFHKKRIHSFINLLDTNKFMEIIKLPDYSELIEKKIPVGFTVFTGSPVYYDVFTFRTQLENIISLLKHHPNYTVFIAENMNDELTIYAKENLGLIVMKYSSPSISFAINEPFMTQAFVDYLKTNSPYPASSGDFRSQTIDRISEYIKGLKDL